MVIVVPMSVIQNRLKKRLKHLKKWAKKEEIEAYRLYDRDIPEYPYQIDLYGEQIVLFDRSQQIDLEKQTHYTETLDALSEIFNCSAEQIFIKSRLKQKGTEQYEKITREAQLFQIKEKQATFQVNLSDYLDTGLFLDHRPLRQIVFEQSKPDLKMLNLFSYTCSMGVFSALNGAITTNVDLSTTYLKWGMENYKLNNVNPGEHRFIKSDVKEYLENDDEKFDLIVLDPPTFSNSKSMDYTFDIQKMAEDFLQLCLKKLNPNGVLYFSTNKRDFKWNPSWISEHKVENLTEVSIPEDFRDKKIHQLFKILN